MLLSLLEGVTQGKEIKSSKQAQPTAEASESEGRPGLCCNFRHKYKSHSVINPRCTTELSQINIF